MQQRITILSLCVYAALVVLLSLWPVPAAQAQEPTDTPTPTATHTPTHTPTATLTPTPDTVAWGTLEADGQPYAIRFEIDAGDVFLGALGLAQTVLLGLMLITLRRRHG